MIWEMKDELKQKIYEKRKGKKMISRKSNEIKNKTKKYKSFNRTNKKIQDKIC